MTRAERIRNELNGIEFQEIDETEIKKFLPTGYGVFCQEKESSFSWEFYVTETAKRDLDFEKEVWDIKVEMSIFTEEDPEPADAWNWSGTLLIEGE